MTVLKTTLIQDITTGSVAGGIEVLVNHPLWSIKTRLQTSQAFTLNPSLLYRGLFANTLSMVPITGLQVSLDRYLQKRFFYNEPALSYTQKFSTALIAGVASSAITAPTEMLMTYQGQTGLNFYKAIPTLIAERGVAALYTGLTGTAIREGLFTAFFLGMTPVLKEKIQSRYSNPYFASIAAGTLSGLGATLTTQGADTIKTLQQSASPLLLMNFKQTAKKIYREKGIKGFFPGTIARGLRVISAITLMEGVTEKMEKAFDAHNRYYKG